MISFMCVVAWNMQVEPLGCDMAELPAEEIKIVEFTEEDAEEISELFRTVWPLETDYPESWRKKRMYTPEQIIEEMRSGYHYFGARLRGRIVGVYKAKITEKGLYGEHQTVLPSCRSSGLASAMYIQFAEYARAHGCKRNYCNILVGNKVGEHLMRKFGFRPWGEPYEQDEGMLVQMYERILDESVEADDTPPTKKE
ncbi:MAG: GNAT family N-acetyltransferase [Candidatus Thorarchaeota archaeon]